MKINLNIVKRNWHTIKHAMERSNRIGGVMTWKTYSTTVDMGLSNNALRTEGIGLTQWFIMMMPDIAADYTKVGEEVVKIMHNLDDCHFQFVYDNLEFLLTIK